MTGAIPAQVYLGDEPAPDRVVHAGLIARMMAPLGLTQPTISHHLKILVDAGIFTRDQRGKWAYYALVPGALDAVSAVLSASA